MVLNPQLNEYFTYSNTHLLTMRKDFHHLISYFFAICLTEKNNVEP